MKHTPRRAVITGLGLAAGSILYAPFVRRARADESKELVLCGFGGAYQDGQTKAYIEPFQQETGIKVIQTSGPEIAKLRAQVQSKNVEWDVVTFSDRLRTTAIKQGLFQKIDYNVVDAKDILPNLVTPYGVGHILFTMQLTYSTSFYKSGQEPKTWADYWDLKHVSGIRGMYNAAPYSLEMALLADGVPKDKLYPLDAERAFKKLDQIKDKVVWWDQFPQPAIMLDSGTINMTPYTRGPSMALLDHKPIGISFDQHIASYEAWMVPKGARHADTAMKFINFAIKAERQAALTKYFLAGPTNLKAMPLLDPAVAKVLPSTPEHIKQGLLFDGVWWSENLDKMQEKWSEWRLAR
jgi:putative spermidine/putrescine transport system substrate-binding protein